MPEAMNLEEFARRGFLAQKEIDEIIRPNPEWGLPVRVEERRFYRLIDERQINWEGHIQTEDITLGCGHTTTYVVPLPPQQRYAPCMQCVEEYIIASKNVESTRVKDLRDRP